MEVTDGGDNDFRLPGSEISAPLNRISYAENLTNHLVLFFDEEWNTKSNLISYGHNIEDEVVSGKALIIIAGLADNQQIVFV